MTTCTLTIVDDFHGEYEDDILHLRSENEQVSGPLGGSQLVRETVRVLDRLIAKHEDCKRDELRLLGKLLYTIAFGEDENGGGHGPPPLRRAFERTYARHRSSRLSGPFRLRLVLNREAGELGRYPWEFLYMPLPEGENSFFLAGEKTELILSRYVPNRDFEASEEDRSPLRILVVLSRPVSPGLAQAKADGLIKAVEKLRDGKIDVLVLDSPTREDLRQAIEVKPTHVIHFIGHGRANAIALKKDERQLRIARADLQAQGEPPNKVDEADWADNESIRALLRSGLDDPQDLSQGRPRGRLIFLHACDSARSAALDDSLRSFSSIARDLAYGERVAAVVAMQYAIGIEDAERFAVAFYERLQDGKPLDEAVSKARWQLGVTAGPGRQVWDHRSFGTPVIYVRQESAFFRYEDIRRQDDHSRPTQTQIMPKTHCPNTQCDHLVIHGQGRCRECQSRFTDCPREGCAGVVMTTPGAGCTLCSYEVPAREGRGPGDGSAQRSEPPTTGFDTGHRTALRSPEDHSDGRGLRMPNPRGPAGDIGWEA